MDMTQKQLDLLNEAVPTDMDPLQQLRMHYLELQNLQDEAEQLELKTKTLNQHILRKQLAMGEIMSNNGMTKLETVDGRTIHLKTTVYGSTSTERMFAIRDFLAERNQEEMIKPDKLPLQPEDIPLLPDELQDRVIYGINTNTLKAYLRELYEAGELDERATEIFKAHVEHKITLK